MRRLLRHLRLWLIHQIVSDLHNHPEGSWSYNCPACGLPEYQHCDHE